MTGAYAASVPLDDKVMVAIHLCFFINIIIITFCSVPLKAGQGWAVDRPSIRVRPAMPKRYCLDKREELSANVMPIFKLPLSSFCVFKFRLAISLDHFVSWKIHSNETCVGEDVDVCLSWFNLISLFRLNIKNLWRFLLSIYTFGICIHTKLQKKAFSCHCPWIFWICNILDNIKFKTSHFVYCCIQFFNMFCINFIHSMNNVLY